MRWIAFTSVVALTAGCSHVEPARPGEQRSGLFLIEKGGRYGYMNRSGEIKIPPQFDQAGTFSDGLAAVAVGSRAGFIDDNGKFAINPQFDSASPFSEDMAAVRIGNDWGFIDKTGKVVIPAQYQNPGVVPMQFSQGLVAVNHGRGTPVGYIDKRGRTVIAPQFDYALPFSDD